MRPDLPIGFRLGLSLGLVVLFGGTSWAQSYQTRLPVSNAERLALEAKLQTILDSAGTGEVRSFGLPSGRAVEVRAYGEGARQRNGEPCRGYRIDLVGPDGTVAVDGYRCRRSDGRAWLIVKPEIILGRTGNTLPTDYEFTERVALDPIPVPLFEDGRFEDGEDVAEGPPPLPIPRPELELLEQKRTEVASLDERLRGRDIHGEADDVHREADDVYREAEAIHAEAERADRGAEDEAGITPQEVQVARLDELRSSQPRSAAEAPASPEADASSIREADASAFSEANTSALEGGDGRGWDDRAVRALGRGGAARGGNDRAARWARRKALRRELARTAQRDRVPTSRDAPDRTWVRDEPSGRDGDDEVAVNPAWADAARAFGRADTLTTPPAEQPETSADVVARDGAPSRTRRLDQAEGTAAEATDEADAGTDEADVAAIDRTEEDGAEADELDPVWRVYPAPEQTEIARPRQEDEATSAAAAEVVQGEGADDPSSVGDAKGNEVAVSMPDADAGEPVSEAVAAAKKPVDADDASFERGAAELAKLKGVPRTDTTADADANTERGRDAPWGPPVEAAPPVDEAEWPQVAEVDRPDFANDAGADLLRSQPNDVAEDKKSDASADADRPDAVDLADVAGSPGDADLAGDARPAPTGPAEVAADAERGGDEPVSARADAADRSLLADDADAARWSEQDPIEDAELDITEVAQAEAIERTLDEPAFGDETVLAETSRSPATAASGEADGGGDIVPRSDDTGAERIAEAGEADDAGVSKVSSAPRETNERSYDEVQVARLETDDVTADAFGESARSVAIIDAPQIATDLGYVDQVAVVSALQLLNYLDRSEEPTESSIIDAIDEFAVDERLPRPVADEELLARLSTALERTQSVPSCGEDELTSVCFED